MPRKLTYDYETVPFDDMEIVMASVVKAYGQPEGTICRMIGISHAAWSTWRKENDKERISQRRCYMMALEALMAKKLGQMPSQAPLFTSDEYLFIAKTAKAAGNTDLAYKAMEGFLDG